MRVSPRALLFSAAALALVVGFQNCSENLPVPSSLTADSSSVTAPPPSPIADKAQITLTQAPLPILPGAPLNFKTQVVADKAYPNAKVEINLINGQGVVVGTLGGPTPIPNGGVEISHSYPISPDWNAGTYRLSVKLIDANNDVLGKSESLANLNVQTPIRVSVGNANDYTDTMGRVWKADYGITGTGVIINNETYPTVQGTPDQILFTFARYGAPGTFSFTSPVPSAGKYKVRLRFMEHFVNAAGKRLFNVNINGTAVLTQYDLFVAAGGMFKARDEVFTVTVPPASLQIKVDFIHGTIENPKINAIEILGTP